MNKQDLKRLQKAHMAAGEAHAALGQAYGLALEAIGEELEALDKPVKPAKPKTTFVTETLRRAPQDTPGSAELSKIERKILVSLAQLDRPASIVTVGIVGEFSHRSSTVDTALAKLRRQAMVEGPKGALRVTQAGRDAIGSYHELPRGHDLFVYWKNKLKSPAGKILEGLRHYPTTHCSIESLAAQQDFSPRSSTVDTALALLKRLGFVEGSKDALCLTGEFKRAIEPGIRVFDRSTGNETLVNMQGHAKR